MASVLAIVSKSVFEAARGADGKKLDVGGLYSVDRYSSTHKALEPLAEGGDLFLVTVRPGDVLWLVAHLVAPTRGSDHWKAKTSTRPIADITKLVPKLRFANGKGLAAKAGALGMSLQTPRTLAASDVALLGGAAASASAAPIAAKAQVTPATTTSTSAKSTSSSTKTAKAAKGAALGASPPSDALAQLIAAAEGALADDDAAKALAAIARAWRVTPLSELVPIADALAQRAESARARALREASGQVSVEAWNAVRDADRLEDLGALAASMAKASLDAIHARAEWLATRAPDPRVASLLARMLRDPPFRATSSQPVWTLLFDHVLGHPDPHTLAVVREVAAGEFPAGAAMRAWAEKKLAATEKKLVAAGASDITATPDQALVLTRLASALGLGKRAPAPRAHALATERATLASGRIVSTERLVSGEVSKLGVSMSGRSLVALVRDPHEALFSHEPERVYRTNALVVLDVETGALRGVVPTGAAALAWALDASDSALAIGTLARVTVVSLVTRRERVVDVAREGDSAPEAQDYLGRVGVAALAFGQDGALHAAIRVHERTTVGGRDWDPAWEIATIDVERGTRTPLFRISRREREALPEMQSIAVSSDGQRMVVTTSTSMWTWDFRWGALAQAFHRSVGVQGSSPQHEDLVAWSQGSPDKRTLRVADVRTGATRTVLTEPVIALDARGSRVLLRPCSPKEWHAVGGPLRIVDLEGADVTEAIPRPDRDNALAVLSPRGDTVWIPDGSALDELRPSAAKPVRSLTWTAPRLEGIHLASGTRVIRYGSSVEVQRGTGVSRLDDRDMVASSALAHDGKTVYLGVGKSIRVASLEGKSAKPKSWAGHTYEVTGLAVARDGTLVSSSRDQLVIVWGADGKVRHRIVDHRAPVLGVALDPSGARIASVGEDGHARIFELASGRALESVAAPGARGPIAFAADGVHVAWLTESALVIAAHGAIVREHALGTTCALAAHPTRPLFAASCADGSVRGLLLDGRSSLITTGLAPAATALSFSDDGQTMLVGACVPPALGALSVLDLSWEAP